ncbi:MAG: TetR/AcrR family transcriptional regulator [Longimicrobiales bacterium]
MPPTDTRDRIVDAARELFWHQGFEATSLAEVAERSDAGTGSIYYFFKTKSDLLSAVLDHYAGSLRSWLIDPVYARTDDPAERLLGIVGTYRTFMDETAFQLGCPVGGLAVEVSAEHADARERIDAIFRALLDALRECAAGLGITGGVPSPDDVAALTMSIIEGGIVQARATASIEPFDRSIACLEDYLDRIRG